MRSNSLGSQSTIRSDYRIPKDISQTESIEIELRDREFSILNYIYDYLYIPNIIVAIIMVVVNVFYLVSLRS